MLPRIINLLIEIKNEFKNLLDIPKVKLLYNKNINYV